MLPCTTAVAWKFRRTWLSLLIRLHFFDNSVLGQSLQLTFLNWIPPRWMVYDSFHRNPWQASTAMVGNFSSLCPGASLYEGGWVASKSWQSHQLQGRPWVANGEQWLRRQNVRYSLLLCYISRLVEICSFEWGFTMNRMIDGIINSVTRITLGHVGACRRRVCVSFWEPVIWQIG